MTVGSGHLGAGARAKNRSTCGALVSPDSVQWLPCEHEIDGRLLRRKAAGFNLQRGSPRHQESRPVHREPHCCILSSPCLAQHIACSQRGPRIVLLHNMRIRASLRNFSDAHRGEPVYGCHSWSTLKVVAADQLRSWASVSRSSWRTKSQLRVSSDSTETTSLRHI